MGDLGQPSDIAHAVAYLASAGAGYVTGQELHVNGGMYMKRQYLLPEAEHCKFSGRFLATASRQGLLPKRLESRVHSQPLRETMSDIEARVKKIIAEQLGVEESQVTNEKAFVADLGADSWTRWNW
jgi:hypothetical protein